MMNLVIYFHSELLPTREEWEAIARSKKIPLIFSKSFDAKTHPICDEIQVNHPDGLVSAKLGEASFGFQLDIYRVSKNKQDYNNEFISEYMRNFYNRDFFKNCNSSAAFRYDTLDAVDSIGAQLAAAILLLATSGSILWPRAKKGYYTGEEAYKALSRAALREGKARAGPSYSFTKKNLFGPVLETNIIDGEWIICPRCNEKFNISWPTIWDGEKHRNCGQMLIVK